jgi:hypothetical protein
MELHPAATARPALLAPVSTPARVCRHGRDRPEAEKNPPEDRGQLLWCWSALTDPELRLLAQP